MSKYNNNFSYSDGVSLKEYLEKRLCDMEKATDFASRIQDEKIEKGNFVREQLREQATTFLTKESYEINHKLLETKIESMQKILNMGLGGLLVLEFLFKFLIK